MTRIRDKAADDPTLFDPSKFDYLAGWETGLARYQAQFKVGESYLNSNDLIVFRYLWRNRFREIITFSSELRMSLKGSGNRYNELKDSIGKIARAGKYSRSLISLKAPGQRSISGKGKRATYVLDQSFKDAIIPKVSGRKAKWEVLNDFYRSGERNQGLIRDAIRLRLARVKAAEAERLLKDKVMRSSQKADGCKPDVTNLSAIIRHHWGD